MTNAAFTVIFIVILAMASRTSVRIGMQKINPVTVFSAIWIVVVLFYQIPYFALLPLADRTWLSLGGAGCALTFSSLVIWIHLRRPAGAPPRYAYDEERLTKAHIAATAALVAYLALEFVHLYPILSSAGGFHAILGGNAIAFRRGYLTQALQNAQTNFSGGSLLFGICGYALFLGTISLFWAGHFAQRGKWRLAAAPLVVMVIYSLVLLQRTAFIYSLVIFLFSWYYHARVAPPTVSKAKHSRRAWPVVFIGLVLLPIVAIVPLQLREPDLSRQQQVQSVATYVVDGLGGLNAISSQYSIDAPVAGLAGPEPGHGYGAWTFGGAASIAKRFGAPIDLATPSFDYVTIDKSESIIDNVYSFILYFYYDFGWLGVLLLSSLFGIVTTFFHRQVLAGSLRAIPAASVLMTSILMSFFGLSLIRDLRYAFVLVVGYAINAAVTRPSFGRSDLPDERKSLGKLSEVGHTGG